MLRLHKIENSIFESNTYILWNKDESTAYVVDCGDMDTIQRFVELHKLDIAGVLLTHGHFDHIYGLDQLLQLYPMAKVYLSGYASRQLPDDKLNYSLFHESPYTVEVESDRLCIVNDGDTIDLWPGETPITVVATPGHDAGCLSYITKDHIFTGDAYIPGIKTVTILRGNKEQAAESVERIKAIISERGLIVCPGHGDIANGLITSL